MEMAKFLMNPVRQRIFQYLLTHGTGTVKEIRRAIPDVSGASLYRHIKQMTERSILQVVGENRIRGTVESVYRLNQDCGSGEISVVKYLHRVLHFFSFAPFLQIHRQKEQINLPTRK